MFAMEPKIHKLKSESGFTLVELYIVMAIMVALFLATYLILNPYTLKQRTRDDKRLSDVNILDRAINEYFIDTATYPDIVNTLRKSNVVPVGSIGPVENATTGWINQNLSSYMVKLPVDPINDSTYYYSYKKSTNGYEIDVKLEYYTAYSLNDGGNDSNLFETGTDLTIM